MVPHPRAQTPLNPLRPSTLPLAVNKLIRSHYLWHLAQMESFTGDSRRGVNTVQSQPRPFRQTLDQHLQRGAKFKQSDPKVSPFKEKKIRPHHEDPPLFPVPKTPTKWNKYGSTFFFLNVPSWKPVCVGLRMISPRSH